MDNIAKTFESLVNRAETAVSRSGEDYIDPADGLLYCGKCRTPKQCRVTAFGKEFTPYCACQCERERLEKERGDFIQRRRAAEIKRIAALSGMPPKLRDCRFENCKITAENEKAYRVCKKYADNFGAMLEKNQGLLLWGGMGTGKTFAAACIANALLDAGIPVVMTSFVTLLGTSGGFEINENFNCAQLLIIDDLGAERGTDFALEKVYGVIDGRYSAGLPMILTTNLSLAEMQSAADLRYARIYERILEICYPVQFKGYSFRIAKAADRFAEMKKFFEE